MSSRTGGVLYLDSSATASTLAPRELRTLDAIHVASALALGPDLAAVVTYDVRMQQAAEGCRLRVLAPA